ncbi:hypothetical protein [Sodalis sp.]|uniref:hypothetical protein n=1 Tax=Sodalis sp. (in: enterobacteria) TaxID=1898979 RepID=UPI00387393FC
MTTDSGVVVNGVNTLPDFTDISMYPNCGRRSALVIPTSLIELVLACYRQN